MAKRGETRPWRVRYEWIETGLKGTETRATFQEARRFADELEATSDRRGMPLAYTVQHRDQDGPVLDIRHEPIEED
jgi:hypothetical protein